MVFFNPSIDETFSIFIMKSVIVFILSSSDIRMVAGDGADDVVDSVVVVVVRGVKRWNGLRVSFGLKNGLRVDTGLDPPVLCVSCCRVVSLAVVKAEGDVVLLDVVLSVVDLLRNGLTGLRRPGNLRRRPNKLLRLFSFSVVASVSSSTLDSSSNSDILLLSIWVVVSISDSVSPRVVETMIGPTVVERLRKKGGTFRVTDVEGVAKVVDLARLGLRRKGGLTGRFFGLKSDGLEV